MRLKELMLKDFPSITFDKIRYRDTDRQGHINNAVFGTYFETGRVELLYGEDQGILSENCSFVVAKVTIDLLNEIHWPGKVDIGTGIIRIGDSSLVIGACLYQNEKLVATSETIVVQVSHQTKKSQSISNDAKKQLEKFKLTLE
ncbi:MAG: acyl-CoA thioesterase [Bacilli bacterium]